MPSNQGMIIVFALTISMISGTRIFVVLVEHIADVDALTAAEVYKGLLERERDIDRQISSPFVRPVGTVAGEDVSDTYGKLGNSGDRKPRLDYRNKALVNLNFSSVPSFENFNSKRRLA